MKSSTQKTINRREWNLIVAAGFVHEFMLINDLASGRFKTVRNCGKKSYVNLCSFLGVDPKSEDPVRIGRAQRISMLIRGYKEIIGKLKAELREWKQAETQQRQRERATPLRPWQKTVGFHPFVFGPNPRLKTGDKVQISGSGPIGIVMASEETHVSVNFKALRIPAGNLTPI